MTKDEAEAIAAEIKRLMTDGTGYGSMVWDGGVVAIGLDDDGVSDPARADDWYVRIDKRTGDE